MSSGASRRYGVNPAALNSHQTARAGRLWVNRVANRRADRRHRQGTRTSPRETWAQIDIIEANMIVPTDHG